MEAASFNVRSFRVPMVSFGIWGFHICSPNPECTWEFDIDEAKCRYMSNEVLESCQYFGRDIARVETPVNKTFEPKLYLMYEKAMRRH